MPQSLELGENEDGRIFDFQISGQSLIKANCSNSRNSDAVDLKLGPVTKMKRKTKHHQKYHDGVMSANSDVIVIFPIFCQFGAIRKPDSGCIVCKTYVFINSNLSPYKNLKQD